MQECRTHCNPPSPLLVYFASYTFFFILRTLRRKQNRPLYRIYCPFWTTIGLRDCEKELVTKCIFILSDPGQALHGEKSRYKWTKHVCHMLVEFVAGSRLFPWFFFRALAFLPSTMTNNSNSNLIRVEDPPAKAAAASSLNTEIYFI